MKIAENKESGFTLIEVAVASVIMMVGLVFLATLFTLAMSQNRMVKQGATTTAIAQQKLEELTALDPSDSKLILGGGLDDASKKTNYYDSLYVNTTTGAISTSATAGTVMYDRYWLVEADPSLTRTLIVTVCVKAKQASKGKTAEQTTLTTIRSW